MSFTLTLTNSGKGVLVKKFGLFGQFQSYTFSARVELVASFYAGYKDSLVDVDISKQRKARWILVPNDAAVNSLRRFFSSLIYQIQTSHIKINANTYTDNTRDKRQLPRVIFLRGWEGER